MIPANPYDDCPALYPLLYGDIEDIEEGGYDLVALYKTPARFVSVGVPGILVVVNAAGEEEVFYANEFTAGVQKWGQIRKVLDATTDTDKYPDTITTTAEYVRVWF